MYFNPISAGLLVTIDFQKIQENIFSFRPVQLRYNRTISKFGFDQLHEYVLKLVDVDKCPDMDEFCPEADKLDITKCLSGNPNSS